MPRMLEFALPSKGIRRFAFVMIRWFQVEKCLPAVVNFWKEVNERRQQREDEEAAVRTASLGHLHIFGQSVVYQIWPENAKGEQNRNNTCARRDQTSPGDYADSCDSVLMVEINETTSNKECEATSEEEHMIEMQSNDAQELEDKDT
ncbi:4341_t:CDS:2, partial [Paraglomus occultum]